MTKIGGQTRLRFDSVKLLEHEDGECRAEVAFSFGERIVNASATANNEGTGPLRAAAAAALEAVELAAGSRFNCVLADLDHVHALGKNLIAVLVNVEFEGKQVQVFGSCQIAGDEPGAAVKAALNATNRFFELAMRE